MKQALFICQRPCWLYSVDASNRVGRREVLIGEVRDEY